MEHDQLYELHCKPALMELKKGQDEMLALLNGNGHEGLKIKVDRNERWRKMVSWSLGILYAGLVGWFIAKI